MPAFRWKSLDQYSAFGQLVAAFMWEQRPPLNPTQLAELTGIDYLAIYRWFNGNGRPEPNHLVLLAQHTPLTIQQVFAAAGYTTEAFPLFSRDEAWEYVRECLMASQDLGLEDHNRILSLVRHVQEENRSKAERIEALPQAPSLAQLEEESEAPE